eukprot:1840660-Heterocapsa_arctica.AAC.1
MRASARRCSDLLVLLGWISARGPAGRTILSASASSAVVEVPAWLTASELAEDADVDALAWLSRRELAEGVDNGRSKLCLISR